MRVPVWFAKVVHSVEKRTRGGNVLGHLASQHKANASARVKAAIEITSPRMTIRLVVGFSTHAYPAHSTATING